eukprot:gene4725-1241_t
MGADTVSWTATATSNHLTTFCERNATEGDAWEAALLWNSIAVILYAWGGGRFGGGGRRFPYFGKFGRRGRGLGGLGGGLIASNGVELQTLKGGWEMKCCLRKVEWVKRDEAIGKSAAGNAATTTTTTTHAFGKTVTTNAPGRTDFSCDVGYLGMIVTSHSFPEEGGLSQPQFVTISNQATEQVIAFDSLHGDPPKSKASILVKETGVVVHARKSGSELARLPIEQIMSFRRDLSPASKKRKGVAAIVLAKSPNNTGLVCHRLVFRKKENMQTFFAMLHAAFADVFRITGRGKGTAAADPVPAPAAPAAPAPTREDDAEEEDYDDEEEDDEEKNGDSGGEEYLECGPAEAWGVAHVSRLVGFGSDAKSHGPEDSAC